MATGGYFVLPKRRNWILVWLVWPFLTLGLYFFWWYYVINKETVAAQRKESSPFLALLAVTVGAFFVVPPFISIYRTGRRIRETQGEVLNDQSCSAVVGLLLIPAFHLYPLYYQYEMNKVAVAQILAID